MLQKMILFWPHYGCSTQDDETQESMEKINNYIHDGVLPREQAETRHDCGNALSAPYAAWASVLSPDARRSDGEASTCNPPRIVVSSVTCCEGCL